MRTPIWIFVDNFCEMTVDPLEVSETTRSRRQADRGPRVNWPPGSMRSSSLPDGTGPG